MNFGEKFPYALLTFSQKLSKLVIGVHYTPIITRTPSSTSTPNTPHTPYPIHQLYTHHTLAIHPPHTPPLRVDSDEMRQNRKVLALRCWNARKGPRMGPKVHEVDSARSSKQGVRPVCCERGRKRRWMRCTARMGRLRILPSLRRQSSRKPYNISENHTNSKKIT